MGHDCAVAMAFQQTRRQTTRGTRADAEGNGKLLLIKRASELRATYQIRLLTFRAQKEGKQLIIDIPKEARIHSSLQKLLDQYPHFISIARA
jgi:hypothetical protein